ncbi:FUSC family protein [Methylobacterium bullatum]|uniref:Integral membrane bound transporter domain-containing protein n=2 Tax=Methylobacterium bullatum TaxID=570505 RepID=A0AAV4Z8F0_9HYPH|nr:FUSC family protein [Methylobacterium bullatum]GJD39809.1 hypothetical protein OICFNHDK_2273 [Methylobacterium bullatum]
MSLPPNPRAKASGAVSGGLRRGRVAGFLMGRGSLSTPGSNLARLPIALDPRGLSIIEGIRAACAFGTVILLHEFVAWPPLLIMALAANLTCFADIGGPMRSRLMVLAVFSVIGSLIWSLFGLLQPHGPALVVPLATLVIFCCSYARVWGVQEQTAGNVLVLVLAFALDRPLTGGEAVIAGAMVLAGGLWATVLALALWRLNPYRPTQRAVAEVWRRLALLSGDLEDLAASDEAGAAGFDDHARAHRRGVREAIELARGLIVDLARSRERVSDRTAQALIRLESAEQIFAALIALSDRIEADRNPNRQVRTRRLLRRLRPLLLVVARAIRDDTVLDLPRIERSIARAGRGFASDPALKSLAERILDRVRIGAKLSTPEGYRPGGTLLGSASLPLRQRMLGPLKANFTLASPNLRHAIRASTVTAPVLGLTLLWPGPFTHWLTITVVLTMQPFYAATWQRALERIGGTVLGGLFGALLASLATTTLALAALIFPLSIIGFAARQVSYAFFIACLTPLVVLLVEVMEPGHASWEVAGMRALFTLLGGLIAVASSLLLWPVWEPDQVRLELRKAVKAHADFARTVLSNRAEAERRGAAEAAARASGLALNSLEAALSRALQQPRAGRHPQVETAMVADATLRRIGARLSALRHAAEPKPALAEELAGDAGDEAEACRAWTLWITTTLARLAEDGGALPALPAHPALPRAESLVRLVTQVELLAETLRPQRSREAAAPAEAVPETARR